MTTPFTEEQLRRITEDGPGHPCSLQEMAVARQCLDLMARERAALTRAEAAEALLREVAELGKQDIYDDGYSAWFCCRCHCEPPAHAADCIHTRLASHLASVQQQTKGPADAENNEAHS